MVVRQGKRNGVSPRARPSSFRPTVSPTGTVRFDPEFGRAIPDVARDQASMSPMPAPPGGIGRAFFFDFSDTIASVVTNRPATETASCGADGMQVIAGAVEHAGSGRVKAACRHAVGYRLHTAHDKKLSAPRPEATF